MLLAVNIIPLPPLNLTMCIGNAFSQAIHLGRDGAASRWCFTGGNFPCQGTPSS
jgi:hypothetical protein